MALHNFGLTTSGIGAAKEHSLSAVKSFFDWMQLKTLAQKYRAEKTGMQIGGTAIFGAFLLVWLEVGFYQLFITAMRPFWAAFLLFGINTAIAGVINFVFSELKKRSTFEAEAENKIELAQNHILAARSDLIMTKNELIERANEFVQNKIIPPYQRYKMPVAMAAAFVGGYAIARAITASREIERDNEVLVPALQPEPLESNVYIPETFADVRSLI